MLNRFFRRWSMVGLLVIVLAMSGACVADAVAEETDYILGEFGKDSAPSGPLAYDGELIVYSSDVPDLLADVRSETLEVDKRDVVGDYLTQQDRIDCILEKLAEAAENDTDLGCQGTILVRKEGKHGLPALTEVLESINTREDEPTKRGYLSDYIDTWSEYQRVERVGEGLEQIKRTSEIPVFGSLVSAMHNFPIMYEGNVLVPQEDISVLIDEYHSYDAEEARRQTVTDYLNLNR